MADRNSRHGKVDKPKVVFLNHKTGRYDLTNLPHKKSNRKSSSFARRKVEVPEIISENLSETGSDQPIDLESSESPESCSFSVTIANKVDIIQAYKLELIAAQGFVVLHRQPSRVLVAMQDYDASMGTLKTNQFHIVDCVLKAFTNGCYWVPTCTCNPRAQDLVDSLIYKLSQTFEDFQSSSPLCLHGNTTMYFINQFEAFNDLDTASYQSACDHDYVVSCEVHELPSSCDIVCVNGGGSRNYGFVGIFQNKLTCLSCQFNKHNCIHMQNIEKALSASDPNLPSVLYSMVSRTKNESQTESASGPIKYSQHPIPYIVPEYLQTLFQTGLQQTCLLSSGGFAMIPTITGSSCTVCGSHWSTLDPVVMGWTESTTIVFTMKTLFWCKVYFSKCSNHQCKEVIRVDGREYGVLWIGKRMIGYEVLRDFMHFYLHTGITLHSFFQIWEQRHFDSGSSTFRHYIDYNSWRFAWFGFLELLDINYEECFSCNICGNEPRVIICDATSVSFQSKFTQSTNTVHSTGGETIRQGR